ncbi:MAG: carbohydrate ABC transporter permease [Bacillota bacterium]|jgi:multiple sugar transport system permease protein|nr:carbohydrate ABC transporter permease [Bacillota bacterium]HHT90060.1 carbohydrate ABC transporter permease [Bacillota bacterium]
MLVEEKKTRPGHYLSFVFLLGAAIIALLPLYWMVVTALQQPTLTVSFPPEWFPSNPTFLNFQRFFGRPHVLTWTTNSLIVALAVTGIQIFTCAMAGYAFAKKKFPGGNFLFYLYIASMMIPGQVTLVPLFLIMSRLNLLDTYAGLVLPGIAGPFGVFLMKQFISTLPTDLIEAATIDGCGEWLTFMKVILPLAKPGLAVLGIFTFMGQWNQFLWPLIITNSSSMRTLPVGLALLQEELPMQYGLLMAGATYAAIPMIIIFLMFQKYFLRGITVGALKG